MIKKITPQDAHIAIDKERAHVIDVREQEEYDDVHIKSAQLLPLSMLSETIKSLALPEGKDIIIHCRKGPRGDKAAEIFQAAGYDLSRFSNMEGGITAWEEQGLPVIKG